MYEINTLFIIVSTVVKNLMKVNALLPIINLGSHLLELNISEQYCQTTNYYLKFSYEL